MTEAIQRRTKAVEWCIQMYRDGQKVTQICEAAGITPPTLYRYLRMAETPLARRPERWNDTGEPCPHRQAASLTAWQKRQNEGALTLKRLPKDRLNTLEVLNRVNLSMGRDNLGQYIYRGDDSRKVYLTEREFDLLCKDPISTLKTLAHRINAGLAKEAV